MVGIQAFEPYHIGIKLQAHVDLGVLGNKLRDYLKDKQYTLPSRAPVEFVASIPPAAQVLGTKNEIRVWFNISAIALNVTGSDPEKVIEVFKEVIRGLTDLGYDLSASVVFYEILATIVVTATARPVQKINNAMHISLDSMKDLGEVVVDSFRIINIKPVEDQGALNLVIEPNPNNPEKSYSVRLQYRSPKSERIEKFHSSLKDRIINVMKSIESV
jgi:hypothetical protein